jgi:thiamine-phosphate pyrophosphorylase
LQDFRLYVILDTGIGSRDADILEIARKTISGRADILQLRAKDDSDRKILKTGRAIKSLTAQSQTLFVLNDRVDLANILDADGVHLGQDDLPVQQARKILGKDKIIGVSTHSVDQARAAEREGADYIAVGPIFATATKPKATPLGPEIISRIKDEIKVPFVAVGGIDLKNLKQLMQQGAKRVAVCRAIITVKDITKATERFRQRLYL